MGMKVHTLVRDRVIVIDCGDGYQRVKWLAMVAAQRYDDLLAVTDGAFAGVGKKHVPVGLEDEVGRRIPPTKTVNRLPAALGVQDGAEPHVRVLLLDDVPGGAKNGTSPFLTAIAAVPEMCLVTGSGLVSCAPRHHATFTVYCRDNFSIPISNGGEDLSVQFTSDAGLITRADVSDHNDGSYSVSYSLPKRGGYVVDITIDGDHVVGSPFECVAVDSELPTSLKWMRPSFCNGMPPSPDEADLELMRALPLSPTDALLLGERLDVAWALHTPNLKFTRHTLKGQFPPPAPQCPEPRVKYASTLVGGRLVLHGGAKLNVPPATAGFGPVDGAGHSADGATGGGGGGAVSDGAGGEVDPHVDDALWILDVEARTWHAPQTKGTQPPCLMAHAMSSHASLLFLHGGRTGRSFASACSDELYVLATGPMVWERVAPVAAPGHTVPTGRWGHSLTTIGSRLFTFGGQQQNGELCAGPHIFDLATRDWSAPILAGAKPKPRRGHSAAVWGRFLVIAMGTGRADRNGSSSPAATGGGAVAAGAGGGATAAAGSASEADAIDDGSVLLSEVALIDFGSIESAGSSLSRPKRLGEVERLSCSTHGSSASRSGHTLIVTRQLLVLCGRGGEPSALPLVFQPNGHALVQTERTEVLVPQVRALETSRQTSLAPPPYSRVPPSVRSCRRCASPLPLCPPDPCCAVPPLNTCPLPPCLPPRLQSAATFVVPIPISISIHIPIPSRRPS
jgi:hypothetical protein